MSRRSLCYERRFRQCGNLDKFISTLPSKEVRSEGRRGTQIETDRLGTVPMSAKKFDRLSTRFNGRK